MKEVWQFLKWHWNSWSLGQKLYIIAAGFFGSGITSWVKGGEPPWQIYVAFTIMGAVLAKWVFIDSVVHSWKQFKQEKKDIFRKIEEGK